MRNRLNVEKITFKITVGTEYVKQPNGGKARTYHGSSQR
jgi:hypothetical protein